jgi:hypothetical protein
VKEADIEWSHEKPDMNDLRSLSWHSPPDPDVSYLFQQHRGLQTITRSVTPNLQSIIYIGSLGYAVLAEANSTLRGTVYTHWKTGDTT